MLGQALLDIYTLRDNLGTLEGKNITILGDILFSRVARSNLWGLSKLGANVTFAGPSTLVPKDFEELGAKVTHNLDNALDGAPSNALSKL